MSSSAQIAANRQNAQLSSGPRTPEGRSVSSRNATTHGLSAGFLVLPHEDQAAFDNLLLAYDAEFTPRSEHESFLVEQMVQSRWKLARINRLEVEVVRRMCDPEPAPASPDAILAASMLEKTRDASAALQRHSAAAERSYYRARRELLQERTRLAKAEPEPRNEPAAGAEKPPVQIKPNMDQNMSRFFRRRKLPRPPARPIEAPV